MLQLLITHGSYAFLFVFLILGGFGVPVPEDLVLLTGGVLAHRGVTSYPITLLVCSCAILIADSLIFTAGRKLGPAAYNSPRFAKLLPPERRERIERLYAKRGGLIIMAARCMAGLRYPCFAMAGIQGMKLRSFMMWDALALCVYAPLITGLGYLFSNRLDLVMHGIKKTEHFALLGAVLLLAAYWLATAWRMRGKRVGKPPHPQ